MNQNVLCVILGSLLMLGCGNDKQAGVVIETNTLSARVVLPPSAALDWKSAKIEAKKLSADSLTLGQWGFDSLTLGTYALTVLDSSGAQWTQGLQVDTLRSYWVAPQGPFAGLANPVMQQRSCGVGAGAGQWSVDNFCWYVEADAFEGTGNSSVQMLGAGNGEVSALLSAGDSSGVDVYAKLNGTFSPNLEPYNLSYYSQLTIGADIPVGDSIEVQLLQSDSTVNYHVWYTKTLVGKGSANYLVPFADLAKWKPAIAIDFNPAQIYGISFRNQKPNQSVSIRVFSLSAQ